MIAHQGNHFTFGQAKLELDGFKGGAVLPSHFNNPFDLGRVQEFFHILLKTMPASESLNEMKGVKKADLPAKICPVCNRPFAWRKKMGKVLGGSRVL